VRRARLASTVVAAVLAVGTISGAASAASRLQRPPATAQQVAGLVDASSRIGTLAPSLATRLTADARDWWTVPYPRAASCTQVGACVFGAAHAARTVVLFGDSHAAMWLPALATAAAALEVRLVLVFKEVCPPASLPSYSYSGEPPVAGCAAFRAGAIDAIHRLAPAAVLVGEQTAGVFATTRKERFTEAQWESALAETLGQLSGPATRVGVLEDIPYFDSSPPSCLAAFPSDVQRCAVDEPNPAHPGFEDAEAAAARATGAVLVRTTQWLCRSTCSPVIGRFVPYVDAGHISATYATYLRGVMTTALRALLGDLSHSRSGHRGLGDRHALVHAR
jgi:hypothetical protein